MITRITDANQEAYNKHFELLNQQIKAKGHESELQISNLVDLFGNLKTLVKDWGIDTKYIIFPADEPLFEIDANTRVITVPEHFRKNGISVQGDDLAETIYFKIYKYFDINDFFANSKIEVNWKMTSGNKTVEGITEIDDKLDDLDHDYIIFAWPIDSSITIGKGTLQFSVTITGYAEGVNDAIGFIYNTLPASVNINGGLVLNNATKVTGLSERMKARFVNSKYTPANATPLQDLKWEEDLPAKVYYGIEGTGDSRVEAETIELEVTPKASELLDGYEYTWASKKTGAPQSSATTKSSISDEDANKFEVNSENGYTGFYSVQVQGKKKLPEGEQYQTTQILKSATCEVPTAVAPEIILTASSIDHNKIPNYDGEEYIYIADTDDSVHVVATIKFQDPNDPGKIVLIDKLGEDISVQDIYAKCAEDTEDLSTIQGYTWFADDDDMDEMIKDHRELTIAGKVPEGSYQVIAVNNRNHSYVISRPSNKLQFSYIADASKFDGTLSYSTTAPKGPSDDFYYYGGTNQSATVNAVLTLGAYYEGLKDASVDYYWQKKVGDEWVDISNTPSPMRNFLFSVDGANDFRIRGMLKYHGTYDNIYSTSFRLASV